jgi:hypothetical protein
MYTLEEVTINILAIYGAIGIFKKLFVFVFLNNKKVKEQTIKKVEIKLEAMKAELNEGL